MKYLKDRSQAKLTTFTATKVVEASCSTSQPHAIELFTVSDASLKAEVYWLGKLAVSNYSLCSSDHIRDLFQAMFPDSRIAENFTLSCTSASYIIGQGLAPYFTQVIIDDLLESKLPFSVHFDETTIKIKQRKQIDLTLGYWSPKHKEVWAIFYTSLSFGHAKGENVAAVMYGKMVKDGLPVEKLATLVRDGPSVNKTIF